jgi:hypothetical protein
MMSQQRNPLRFFNPVTFYVFLFLYFVFTILAS